MDNHKNPLTLIIFGATGDLYKKKLSSALWSLFKSGALPREFKVVGFGRRPMTDLDFQNFTKEAVEKKFPNEPKSKFGNFLSRFEYLKGDLTSLQSFKDLGVALEREDAKKGFCANKLFYLAVPPALYGTIFMNIYKSGLTVPCAPSAAGRATAWTRVLVEKPFGNDIVEARRLDKMLGELFDESQIFRIDHYLAKETMQDLLDFRFASGSESLWSRENVEYVRIIFHEADNGEDLLHHRGSFYDAVGALRDVGQNHMLQMLALMAMDNPKDRDAKEIQEARGKVLEKTFLIKDADRGGILRGQYHGYLDEPNIKTGSKTETFFRVTLGIDNKRWKGVPFKMECGKALDREEMSIEVCFKKMRACLKFLVSSDKKTLCDAYEKVLYDCISGDQTRFVSTKEIMAQWAIVTDIIKKWRNAPLVIYPKGVSGVKIK